MKFMNAALITVTIFAGAFAHAGAYRFSCSDANGAISISKSSAYLKYYDKVNDQEPLPAVEWTSKTLPFPNEKPEHPETAVSIEVVGKVKQIVYRDQTDECGNVGKEDIYVAKLIVRDPQGKLISSEQVICDQSFYPGHCY